MSKLTQKVSDIYQTIKSDYYLGLNDLEIGDNKYNSTLLLATLTELTKGNMLLYGEYGGGKTTSAEYLHTLFNGLPLDLVKRVSIRGNPQHTQESMIAVPNYASINSNSNDWANEVLWNHFVLVGPKIIDEFNRIPEPNQAIVLNGVERGDWGYLRSNVSNGSVPFFGTCNYTDSGNNTIIPPIIDRFDIATESKFPGIFKSLSISTSQNQSKSLENEELTHKALELLNAPIKSQSDYRELQEKLNSQISTQFQENIKKTIGIDLPTKQDLKTITNQINQTQLSTSAQLYLSVLIAEMNVCPKHGQKRSIDQRLSDTEFLNSQFTGSGSRRFDAAVVKYAKALAWFQEEKEVQVEHLTTIAPYALWHRVEWEKETELAFENQTRNDPLDLHIAKSLIGQGSEDTKLGVESRFNTEKITLEQIFNNVAKDNIQQARDLTQKAIDNGKGHPIFHGIEQELIEDN